MPQSRHKVAVANKLSKNRHSQPREFFVALPLFILTLVDNLLFQLRLLRIKNAKLFLANPWLEFSLISQPSTEREVINLRMGSAVFLCQQPQRGPDKEKSEKALALPESFLENFTPLVAAHVEMRASGRCRWCSDHCFWLTPEAVEEISETETTF